MYRTILIRGIATREHENLAFPRSTGGYLFYPYQTVKENVSDQCFNVISFEDSCFLLLLQQITTSFIAYNNRNALHYNSGSQTFTRGLNILESSCRRDVFLGCCG